MVDTGQRPIRVLQVLSGDVAGGAEISFVDMAAGFDREKVVPYAAISEGCAYQCLVDLFASAGIKHTKITPYPWKKKNPIPYIKTVREIARAARACSADIIAVNHPASFADYSYFAGKIARRPVIVHFRMLSGGSEGEKWMRNVNARFYEKCAALVQPSQAAKTSLEDCGIVNDSTYVIYEGVDTGKFSPQKRSGRLRDLFGISAESVVLGFVGRIVEAKGACDLADAFFDAAGECGDMHLVYIGDYRSSEAAEFVASIEKNAQEKGFSGRLHFTGFWEDISDYVADLDIMALPTHAEAFGKSFIEAMACGVACIGTRVGGVPEIIEHEKNGILVEAHDTEALAREITRLSKDAPLRKAVAQSGLETVREKFTIEAQCENTYKMYREVLGR